MAGVTINKAFYAKEVVLTWSKASTEDRDRSLDAQHGYLQRLQRTAGHLYHGQRTLEDRRYDLLPSIKALRGQLEYVDLVIAGRLGVKTYQTVLWRAFCQAAQIDTDDQQACTAQLNKVIDLLDRWADYSQPRPSNEEVTQFGYYLAQVDEQFYALAAETRQHQDAQTDLAPSRGD